MRTLAQTAFPFFFGVPVPKRYVGLGCYAPPVCENCGEVIRKVSIVYENTTKKTRTEFCSLSCTDEFYGPRE